MRPLAKRCHVWLFGRLEPLVEMLSQFYPCWSSRPCTWCCGVLSAHPAVSLPWSNRPRPLDGCRVVPQRMAGRHPVTVRFDSLRSLMVDRVPDNLFSLLVGLCSKWSINICNGVPFTASNLGPPSSCSCLAPLVSQSSPVVPHLSLGVCTATPPLPLSFHCHSPPLRPQKKRPRLTKPAPPTPSSRSPRPPLLLILPQRQPYESSTNGGSRSPLSSICVAKCCPHNAKNT